MTGEVRIDKWLWAVRLYKTRTIAAEACRKGQVSLGGVNLKPSRMVRVGDVVSVQIGRASCRERVLRAV